MKATPSEKIKIGIFTIAGLLLLAAGVFFIGKQRNLFGRTFAVWGTFRNVGGLQVGNNVRFGGINVGTVTNIQIMNDTTVRVDMRMKQHIKRFVKDNATASIGSDGLMGDKLITISPGTSNAPEINNGGRVLTVDPMDLDKITKKLSDIADNAATITSGIASITTQISGGHGTIGRLLYSDSLERSLEGTATAAHQAINSIKKGSEGFSDNMDALKHNILLRGYFKKKEKKHKEKIKEPRDSGE